MSLVVTGMGISAGIAEDQVPHQDALPTYPETGQWVPLRAAGLNYAGSAKQWIRLPSMTTSAFNRSAPLLADARCPGGRLYPYTSQTKRHATMHFLSPTGARRPYGYVGPFTVRTVAFGTIPVEADVQLQQPRDAQDKTIGLEFNSTEGDFCPGTDGFNFPDTETAHVRDIQVQGELRVAITRLRVDGVSLKLRDTCRTAEPAAIKLTAPEYFQVMDLAPPKGKKYYLENRPDAAPLPPEQIPDAANLLTTNLFQPVSGGLLTGNITIPPFSGCLTSSGEDVSRLLTTTVAGNDNPVSVRSEGIQFGGAIPPGPFPPMAIPTTAP